MTRALSNESSESFTLALTGDVMLGRLVNERIAYEGHAWPWGDMLPLLQGADLLCINLECALTATTQQWTGDPDKPFFFRADPEVVETLRLAGVGFASIANNHILDFGTEGLLETVAVLDRAGIAHAGAGSSLEGARAPAIISVNGWTVAILAVADYPEAWCATGASPGMCFTPISLDPASLQPIEEMIAHARSISDLVILSIHWGPNMRLRPPPLFREFARRMIAAGVDVLWGHSAHVVQGVELADGRPILYDTGDFVDDYAVDPSVRNDLGALFLLRVRPPSVERITIVPAVIREMQACRATGDTRAFIARNFRQRCNEMGTKVSEEEDGLVVRR